MMAAAATTVMVKQVNRVPQDVIVIAIHHALIKNVHIHMVSMVIGLKPIGNNMIFLII